jgi:hypothetical protein
MIVLSFKQKGGSTMLILNRNLIRDTYDGFRLATLGPAGTSSEYVAGKVLDRLDISDKKQ